MAMSGKGTELEELPKRDDLSQAQRSADVKPALEIEGKQNRSQTLATLYALVNLQQKA